MRGTLSNNTSRGVTAFFSAIMDLTLESKACVACTKAKRKCGKQIPACGRCASRGVHCDYSQPASTFSVPPREPEDAQASKMVATASASEPLFELSDGFYTLDNILAMDFDYTLTAPDCPRPILDLSTKKLSVPWYMESASWELKPAPHSEDTTAFCNSVFLKYIQKVQQWQARWVTTGSNPYVHKYIYKYNMPRSIQDAYTFLATYINTTPENKQTILHLLEERVKQLLHDQPDKQTPQDAATANTSSLSPRTSNLTLFDHLTRVQALHTYQTIGLFDGSIRARHVAETQIPTLNAWMRAMLDAAQTTAALGTRGPFVRMAPGAQQPQPALGADDEAAWLAWVVGESVRRVWIVGTATQNVFLALQVKYAPCPGAAAFHTREGLWEAGLAFEWARRCGKVRAEGGDGDGVEFVERGAWERVFACRRPGEVDEFTRSMMEVTFGSERIEKWAVGAA